MRDYTLEMRIRENAATRSEALQTLCTIADMTRRYRTPVMPYIPPIIEPDDNFLTCRLTDIDIASMATHMTPQKYKQICDFINENGTRISAIAREAMIEFIKNELEM